MGKPITVILDEELIKKLRSLQAKKLMTTNQSISFSKVLNDVLEKGLKR